LKNEDYDIESQAEHSSFQRKRGQCFKKSNAISLLDKINNTDIQLDFNLPVDVYISSNKKENWSRAYNLNLHPQIHFQLYPLETFEFTISFKLSKHKSS
ncbi:MAG: hypothetical protein PF447_02880, partial [Spirochaetaceae bacterium]|nr:hypothetical protein [Spirochaetaceae bacterium]